MFRLIRNYAGPLFWSVMLHALVFVLLVVSLARAVSSRRAPPPQVVMKATVVDEGRIEQELKRLELEDQRERVEKEKEQRRLQEEAEQARRAKEEEQRQLEALQAKRKAEEEAEAKRQVELKRKRDEEETKRQAEAKRKQQEEEARQAEAKRKQQEEEARLVEVERKRKAEEERLAKLEQERKEGERRAAEAKRQKEEAERKRKADEAALAVALAAEEEADFQASLREEEQRLAALNSGLLDQYRTLISQKVERNWLRPPSARPGIECEVHVRQIPGGDVVGVRVGRCNGDEAVVRSIEAAVQRASPLPDPPDRSLFESNLIFEFRPAE